MGSMELKQGRQNILSEDGLIEMGANTKISVFIMLAQFALELKLGFSCDQLSVRLRCHSFPSTM